MQDYNIPFEFAPSLFKAQTSVIRSPVFWKVVLYIFFKKMFFVLCLQHESEIMNFWKSSSPPTWSKSLWRGPNYHISCLTSFEISSTIRMRASIPNIHHWTDQLNKNSTKMKHCPMDQMEITGVSQSIHPKDTL